jgi:crotonobetainyl-CoA:carnitine CoA-transferase CaiB-like acyl-CoA transferase
MVATLTQPGAGEPVKLLGVPIKLSRTPGDPSQAPGPALGEHTEQVLREVGYAPEEIAALRETGAVAGPAESAQGTFMGA